MNFSDYMHLCEFKLPASCLTVDLLPWNEPTSLHFLSSCFTSTLSVRCVVSMNLSFKFDRWTFQPPVRCRIVFNGTAKWSRDIVASVRCRSRASSISCWKFDCCNSRSQTGEPSTIKKVISCRQQWKTFTLVHRFFFLFCSRETAKAQIHFFVLPLFRSFCHF